MSMRKPQSLQMVSSHAGLPQPLLQVQDVSLEYRSAARTVRATHRVSFDVHRGDRFVLLGPSGCGKSSLLKAAAGFIEPVEGSISLKGEPVRGPGPDRVVVFQEFDQLPPWKTVKQNVMFPLVASGRLGRRDAEARALHWLEKVGLAGFADAYPHTLSGGMKQRVAIARALAMPSHSARMVCTKVGSSRSLSCQRAAASHSSASTASSRPFLSQPCCHTRCQPVNGRSSVTLPSGSATRSYSLRTGGSSTLLMMRCSGG